MWKPLLGGVSSPYTLSSRCYWSSKSVFLVVRNMLADNLVMTSFSFNVFIIVTCKILRNVTVLVLCSIYGYNCNARKLPSVIKHRKVICECDILLDLSCIAVRISLYC